MIPAYTCDIETDVNYPHLTELRSCYCNNGDYHTMPTINIEIKQQYYQYDLGPSNYMFLPYLTNTSVPMSRCILGIDKTEQALPNGDNDYVSLGQRAMSQLPYYVVYDRNLNTATLELGGQTSKGSSSNLGAQITISVCIVLALFAMLVYLIYLRRARIQAEEWLELHKNTLFSSTANLKTEEEILEALVKSKEFKEKIKEEQSQA